MACSDALPLLAVREDDEVCVLDAHTLCFAVSTAAQTQLCVYEATQPLQQALVSRALTTRAATTTTTTRMGSACAMCGVADAPSLSSCVPLSMYTAMANDDRDKGTTCAQHAHDIVAAKLVRAYTLPSSSSTLSTGRCAVDVCVAFVCGCCAIVTLAVARNHSNCQHDDDDDRASARDGVSDVYAYRATLHDVHWLALAQLTRRTAATADNNDDNNNNSKSSAADDDTATRHACVAPPPPPPHAAPLTPLTVHTSTCDVDASRCHGAAAATRTNASSSSSCGSLLLRVLFAREADAVYYAELTTTTTTVQAPSSRDETTWQLRAVGRLRVVLHTSATHTSRGRCVALRQLQWLRDTHDYAARHPLVAAVYCQCALRGDAVAADHAAVLMLHETSRNATRHAARACAHDAAMTRVTGALTDGPWAVHVITLAQPSFLFSTTLRIIDDNSSNSNNNNNNNNNNSNKRTRETTVPLLGLCVRPPAHTFAASALLRQQQTQPPMRWPNDDDDDDKACVSTATDTPSSSLHRFVVYSEAGELCSCALPSYVSCARRVHTAANTTCLRRDGEWHCVGAVWAAVEAAATTTRSAAHYTTSNNDDTNKDNDNNDVDNDSNDDAVTAVLIEVRVRVSSSSSSSSSSLSECLAVSLRCTRMSLRVSSAPSPCCSNALSSSPFAPHTSHRRCRLTRVRVRDCLVAAQCSSHHTRDNDGHEHVTTTTTTHTGNRHDDNNERSVADASQRVWRVVLRAIATAADTRALCTCVLVARAHTRRRRGRAAATNVTVVVASCARVHAPWLYARTCCLHRRRGNDSSSSRRGDSNADDTRATRLVAAPWWCCDDEELLACTTTTTRSSNNDNDGDDDDSSSGHESTVMALLRSGCVCVWRHPSHNAALHNHSTCNNDTNATDALVYEQCWLQWPDAQADGDATYTHDGSDDDDNDTLAASLSSSWHALVCVAIEQLLSASMHEVHMRVVRSDDGEDDGGKSASHAASCSAALSRQPQQAQQPQQARQRAPRSSLLLLLFAVRNVALVVCATRGVVCYATRTSPRPLLVTQLTPIATSPPPSQRQQHQRHVDDVFVLTGQQPAHDSDDAACRAAASLCSYVCTLVVSRHLWQLPRALLLPSSSSLSTRAAIPDTQQYVSLHVSDAVVLHEHDSRSRGSVDDWVSALPRVHVCASRPHAHDTTTTMQRQHRQRCSGEHAHACAMPSSSSPSLLLLLATATQLRWLRCALLPSPPPMPASRCSGDNNNDDTHTTTAARAVLQCMPPRHSHNDNNDDDGEAAVLLRVRALHALMLPLLLQQQSQQQQQPSSPVTRNARDGSSDDDVVCVYAATLSPHLVLVTLSTRSASPDDDHSSSSNNDDDDGCVCRDDALCYTVLLHVTDAAAADGDADDDDDGDTRSRARVHAFALTAMTTTTHTTSGGGVDDDAVVEVADDGDAMACTRARRDDSNDNNDVSSNNNDDATTFVCRTRRGALLRLCVSSRLLHSDVCPLCRRRSSDRNTAGSRVTLHSACETHTHVTLQSV